MSGVDADLATLRRMTRLIRDAVGFALAEKNIPHAPTWTLLVPQHLDDIDAAADRVEAELSRLREERDAAISAADGMARSPYGEFQAAWEGRKAAEARCARLEAERNEYAERLQWLRDLREREGSWGKPYERAMAASDPRGGEPYQCEEERDRLAERCARLQQAAGYAEGVLMRDPFDEVQRQHAAQVLREALAGQDTPA